MSRIDLDKFVVKQTYFVPLKSSALKDRILRELNSGRSVYHYVPWELLTEHTKSFNFSYRIKFAYIVQNLWTSTELPPLKKVQESERKFDSGMPKTYFRILKETLGNQPVDLHVFIVEEKEKECLCDVECVPALYRHIFQQQKESIRDAEIQNAHLGCKRFLKHIFHAGLGATLIKEEKELPPEVTTRFLINDQVSRQILKEMETMLDQATGEVLICGWIGTILLPKLKEIKQKGIDIRIITHKSTELKGKTGRQDVQRAHRDLVSLLGKENISMNPECHFRALVVDNKALVGSMDFNATSLTGTHREFAIYTEIPEIVRSIRNYFNLIFTPLSE